jgi:molybdate transport system substrate-binding protein
MSALRATSRRSVVGALGLLGIGAGLKPSGAAEPGSVTVFAAASLADVMRTLAQRPGRRGPPLRFSFAASSTLARQIEQGAPADVFISADEDWMQYLVARQRVQGEGRTFLAANRLVVVRPGSRQQGEPPESVAALRAALQPGAGVDRIAAGDPAHVPAGRYARAALVRLGLWTDLAPRLIHADSVRSALAFVERGEAAAGIVYATDARLSEAVGVAARFPSASHPPIRYPAALVTGAAVGAAEALADFFTPQAQSAFLAAGFDKP